MSGVSSEPFERAVASLEGLSVGDAFGEQFFVHPHLIESLVRSRALPAGRRPEGGNASREPVWSYTDDTNMALSVVASLGRFGCIEQDWLAGSFAERYDVLRGYGPAMHRYLADLRAGADWREKAQALFSGRGSFGNGAAMRVAPLGAYFADDVQRAATEARLSAEVTHAHSEGIAGAVAVAVAAAHASRARESGGVPPQLNFLHLIEPLVPEGEVAARLRQAIRLPQGCSTRHAAAVLGSGAAVSAQDTVPFALWCAAQHLDNFEEAIWETVSGFGDMDTTCAIVGGIVGGCVGREGIPAEWLARREPLPSWHLSP